MVGYTLRAGDDDPDILDWSDTGPFYAYLHTGLWGTDGYVRPEGWPFVQSGDLLLGTPSVEDAGDVPLPVRVSLTFDLPSDLPPGGYSVFLCNQPCTTTLGFVGASEIYVGVDPPRHVVRVWPLDDPAIADMDETGLLLMPDNLMPVSAAQVRAGDLPDTAAIEPDVWAVDDPATTTADPPTENRGANESADQDNGRDADDDATEQDTDLVAADLPSDQDRGPDVGGVVPWLVALAALVVLWCVGWWRGPPRKRVTASGDDSSGDDPSGEEPDPPDPGVWAPADVPSDEPVHIRL